MHDTRWRSAASLNMGDCIVVHDKRGGPVIGKVKVVQHDDDT